MTEWKPVVGYEGFYEVSNDGQIKTVKTGHIRVNQKRRYAEVKLSTPDTPRTNGNHYVHRLVAEAFIGSAAGLEVNHINGDKLDNRVENLELVTPSQNILHAISSKLLGRDDTTGRFVTA
jgi:hypothetical protein